MLGHYAPAEPTSRQFLHDRSSLFAEMKGLFKKLTWQMEQFNPYPFTVSPQQYILLRNIGQAIFAGLQVVVKNYLNDLEMQEKLPLDEAFLSLIHQASTAPYKVGCFRPDFLFDHTGEVRICEINARFSANGFLVSYALDSALEKARYLDTAELKFGAALGLNKIRRSLISEWQSVRNLALVLTHEVATEMTLLLGDLEFDQIHPSQLKPSQYDRVILEMDRQDLLAIPQPTVTWMIETQAARNDLRTNILAHDKRMLSILGDPSIMERYLPKDQVTLLSKHIIPTYAADNEDIRERALQSPQNWVLKPASGGRGVDTYVGVSTDAPRWKSKLLNLDKDYVLQPYIHQKRWSVLSEKNGVLDKVEMHVVGLLPCFNKHVFGPGTFRAGIGTIINVHGHRCEMLPCALGEII